jgi:tRNA nucleotidyltransferase (CCA-adding enzyme)
LKRPAFRPSELRLPDQSPVLELARMVADAGGRVIVVGGWVRDQLIGKASNDFDLEVFGLSQEAISRVLQPLGFTRPVGRHFPVWRETRQAVDVAYPRAGAELYTFGDADSLEIAFREASRYRDLTINAIGWDPLCTTGSHALIDPWNGCADLEARTLRAVDESTFGLDPLRVLRVARLRAHFDARVDPALVEVCRHLSLEGLPVERISVELRRILCESKQPSQAFEFLDEVDHLEVFEPIAALRGVPQDPHWHPEGDVYVHTCMVLDRAAEIAEPLCVDDREILLFAALCHDLGKPETTTVETDRIRSLGHEARSAVRTHDWLAALRLPERLVRSVESLVASHLAPAQFVRQSAGARAYRRLARKLAEANVTVVDLERLARADHLGRSTEDAQRGQFEAGDAFLVAAEAAEVREGVRPDIVSASQLMERGVLPGPLLGRLLACCREFQDETGIQEAARIIEHVLAEESAG